MEQVCLKRKYLENASIVASEQAIADAPEPRRATEKEKLTLRLTLSLTLRPGNVSPLEWK